ncbi:uncharacterized protein LOC111248269 [Varroa destructor]|uniref:ZW10 C-terminal helical domain-containing protein n=1 Tax=Varroa destructor TaxID=109461 RepID=A0A7M7JRF0_VARDE|nr:uncharacterized protein LOC111248269 [Varroa destructor]
MSLAALEKPSLLAARMTDIERDIRRKMDALAKHVEHTELLDESSIQEAGQLKISLEEHLSEVDLLAAQLNDTISSLRQIADQDQKQHIAELEAKIATVNHALKRTADLIEIGDLLEATEACQNDRSTALVYLNRIEESCETLNVWSGGKLRILQSIRQHLVNKRYTLEVEQRKSLQNLKDESNKEYGHDGDINAEGIGDGEENEVSAFLGKIREILRKSLEPTEKLTSTDFGGPGDMNPCRVSFWLRPLVVEILDCPEPSLVIDIYTSYYKHTVSTLSDKEVAIVYCNSMFIAHKVLLHCLLHPSSRVALNSSVGLRRFADIVFHERLQKLAFDSFRQRKTDFLDDDAFKEYPQFLRRYCADLQEILPLNVSEKVLCLLIEDYVELLISVVVMKEDIESNQADLWATILSEILAEIKDIAGRMKIRPLPKAEELKNILSYGLKDFAAHWKNHDSELRTWYQPAEVAHLIKAIFQNSPMRSSVLAQIK